MSSDRKVSVANSRDCDRPAIKVESLDKIYRLYDSPEDRLKEYVWSAFDKVLGREPESHYKEFKALENVSFEVGKGETVGIIGRNGSGKSTLLQIISGTLNPSAGSVEVNGRVAALLELGSGFHPDFTGRENVYMNAAIFGVSSEEVDERFHEISEFANIGEFIEQPVKTYSSGMMLRLAFAVIAHIDADILVIDEALSVGDAVFTQKCMRFIKAFQKRGTLLFVSHDMGAVKNLCQKAVWLEAGRVTAMGATKRITEAYLKSTFQEICKDDRQLRSIDHGKQSPATTDSEETGTLAPDYGALFSVRDNIDDSDGWATGAAEILSISLNSGDKQDAAVLRGGERVLMTITARTYEKMANPILGFLVKDRLGQILFGENTLPFTTTRPLELNPQDVFRAEFSFILPMLPDGEYSVMASVADGSLESNVQHHYLHDALVLTVSSSKVRWGLAGIRFDSVSMEIVDD